MFPKAKRLEPDRGSLFDAKVDICTWVRSVEEKDRKEGGVMVQEPESHNATAIFVME
jgi:hypothetical protein